MAIPNTYIKIIRCHERIHSPKMYSHYFNIWRTCQNKSTIYCISKLKERHMLCYGLSFFCLEKLPALHNKIRKFSKKVTHYVTSRLRIKGMNNTWARLHRKTTIHMIIVCVKVQILLFVVSEHIQWNCYILSKRGNFLWLCYLQKLAISIELVSNIIIVCLLFLTQYVEYCNEIYVPYKLSLWSVMT